MAELLDEELQAWRERPLGTVPYLILDARYEKVRHGGSVRDCAVLIAIGVLESGHRSVLGVSVSLSEAEVHWRTFLKHLIDRGLHGVQLIVSDDHAGLKQARRACFPGIGWQRCQFHLLQNALHYVPKVSLRTEVTQDLRSVLSAPTVMKPTGGCRSWSRNTNRSRPICRRGWRRTFRNRSRCSTCRPRIAVGCGRPTCSNGLTKRSNVAPAWRRCSRMKRRYCTDQCHSQRDQRRLGDGQEVSFDVPWPRQRNGTQRKASGVQGAAMSPWSA